MSSQTIYRFEEIGIGQAKRRGTFEERQSAAIIKDEQQEMIRKAAELERERNMTPKQKQARHQTRVAIASMLGLATGMNVMRKKK